MKKSRRVDVLQNEEARVLRQAYLDRFVDTRSEFYREHVATRCKYSDGLRYDGYIWDCLKNATPITYAEFCGVVQGLARVVAMADDHSRDKVIGPPLWPYPPYSVVSLSGDLLLQLMPALPEDIYVFDRTVSWTLVLTHEHDGQERICLKVGAQSMEDPTFQGCLRAPDAAR